ncbi:MAG: hypothetical protein RL238_3353 [Actinomycetota bacterium]
MAEHTDDLPATPPRHRAAVAVLLAATAALYLWGLGSSGWANSYYSAAVQAGSQSTKAWFFGSLDAANTITVDKPPAALWVMGLSARVFGVHPWSVLLPQALMGVAAVGVLYLTVRRWFGVGAGLIAGAVMALTPAAALMFRFNNPDALLVLVLVGAAYTVTRAIEDGATTWLVWTGALLGTGFLTKMLQAFVVLPALALAYLVAGPPEWPRRVRQLLLGGLAMLATAGCWMAVVALWPDDRRPFIGGSTDDSVLDLVFGYNGFGRLTGDGSARFGTWGEPGLLRLFGRTWAGHASWLVPAALLFAVAGLLITRRQPRTDRLRAAVVVWGGWLLVTGVTISLGEGTIHEYYSVALAPAVGALVGIGTSVLWARRGQRWARALLVTAVVVTACWAWAVLARTPDWNPWLRPLLLVAAVVAVAGLSIGVEAAAWGAGVALAAALLSPAAYSISTASRSHAGTTPGVGPVAAYRPGGLVDTLLDAPEVTDEVVELLQRDSDRYTWALATIGANAAAGHQLATGDPVMPIGGFNGTDPWPTLEAFQRLVDDGEVHYFLVTPVGSSSSISEWVTANFSTVEVDGLTFYDLTQPTDG